MNTAIIRRIDMLGTELLNIEKMVRKSVDEERVKVGKKAIQDLLALSAHPKMKEWSEKSVDEVRRSRSRIRQDF